MFQSVRLPSTVLNNEFGTCLDLAILYCACLENIGLNPILICIDGHAFAGCFLRDECFVERVCEDCGKVFNRSVKDNLSIELVECTMFTKSASSSFSSSNTAARNAIRLYNGSFYAIDIVSCHYSIFRPIPTKQFNEQGELEFNTDIENFNEEFNKKNSVANNIEIFEKEFAISLCEENDIITRQFIAKVSDELVSVDGIRAAFCIGRLDENFVYIIGV